MSNEEYIKEWLARLNITSSPLYYALCIVGILVAFVYHNAIAAIIIGITIILILWRDITKDVYNKNFTMTTSVLMHTAADATGLYSIIEKHGVREKVELTEDEATLINDYADLLLRYRKLKMPTPWEVKIKMISKGKK